MGRLLTEVHREYVLIEKQLQMMKTVPTMSVIAFILFLVDVPTYAPLAFTGFILLIIALSIIELQRIRNIGFDHWEIDSSVVQHRIGELNDEEDVGVVFGILRAAAGFRDIFRPAGASALGTGKSYFPENTLLVTNHRLLFVQIPISGGNKIIEERDYVEQNFLFNRAELRQKGEEILRTRSLSQILKLAINDIMFRDIKKLTLKQSHFIVEDLSGKKLSYILRDRERSSTLKGLLRAYLGGRLIER